MNMIIFPTTTTKTSAECRQPLSAERARRALSRYE